MDISNLYISTTDLNQVKSRTAETKLFSTLICDDCEVKCSSQMLKFYLLEKSIGLQTLTGKQQEVFAEHQGTETTYLN